MSIIKIWIDLGTTNSAIVINNDEKFSIIENTDSMKYTPSVFWYNKLKKSQVWKNAYRNIFESSSKENIQNYKVEVKRLMWTNDKIFFPRWDVKLSAEEISAEILKYLKEQVLRIHKDFDTIGVVITVPAYFDTIQKEATKKAWELAWFQHVVLVQEPIAAAIAYWFESDKDENWLVYDLGWWTFDVAIISSKDWVLTVKWHAWDNYLWWKDIDNLIIDKILIPKIKANHSIDKLDMDIGYYPLKSIAELAKKQLTDWSSASVQIDNWLILDDDWNEICLEVDFTRDQFNELIEPLVDKSIRLCKEALSDSWYSNTDISKIILVWWSTYTPYIREKIEAELWIEVDATVDPLTVVAKGACIFWASQLLPQELLKKKIVEAWVEMHSIKLNYEPMTTDADTMVSWIISSLANVQEEYFIQIQSEDNTYAWNKLKLKNWKFFDNVTIAPWKTNNFFIYLSDNDWTIIETDPDNFSITHTTSGVTAWVPLSHWVSIALWKLSYLDNDSTEYCMTIFERGSVIADKKISKKITVKTIRDLKKWDHENALPIRIYEWESKKPDRNQQILEVKFEGTDVPYDLPAWTEVELTVEIWVSWDMHLKAYISELDLFKSGEFLRKEWREQEDITEDKLHGELSKAEKIYDEIAQYTWWEDKSEIEETIDAIRKQIDKWDTDSKRKSNHEIKELKRKLDKIEDESLSDKLIDSFNEACDRADTSSDIENNLIEKWKLAIENKDWETLENVTWDLVLTSNQNYFNTPEWMKAVMAYYYQERNKSTDPVRVNQLFEQGLQYVNNNDVDWMKAIISEILKFMPQDLQEGMWWVNPDGTGVTL